MPISMKLEGDKLLFERTAQRLKSPKPLFEKIAARGLESALGRLQRGYEPDGLRTGRLAQSLTPGGPGSIFEVSDLSAVIGSNLPYAAQHHFGGRIEPKNAKALAIPLVDALKRGGVGPRDLDEGGDLLRFEPVWGGANGNVFGLLVLNEDAFGFKEDDALYALAHYVDQEPRPFLYWSDEDVRYINENIVPQYLASQGGA